MPKVVYDTSVFIAYKPADFPAGFLMSAVVLQELTAGAVDKSDVQRWDAARRAHEKKVRCLCQQAKIGGLRERYSIRYCEVLNQGEAV